MVKPTQIIEGCDPYRSEGNEDGWYEQATTSRAEL